MKDNRTYAATGLVNNHQVKTEVLSAEPEKIKGTIITENLNAWYGQCLAVKNVSMTIRARAITAIIGPSGCGKSTFIRCLNRLHEISPGGRVSGKVLLDGQDIYAPEVDPVALRRRVGMVFQKPAPFPTMSIFDNVAAGIKLSRIWVKKQNLQEIVERSLRQAALWD
ncbi:MAG: ATP-binding cassette domain-containing protein, partial [Dehalococcoidales bacterium]|nr:ATP-binding cassette domain-containing protein [Dehalococcoidales bacterium]